MIKAIIIDDEAKSRQTLEVLINRYCDSVEIAGTASNVKEGISILEHIHPELLLLDISLSDGSGFDLLSQIKDISFEVIFITAYNEYALQAIKANALDYLLKPVNIRELQAAIAKAEEKITSKEKKLDIKALVYQLTHTESAPSRIAVPVTDGLKFIFLNEITRLEAEGSYTRIFCDTATMLSSKPLKDYEDILPTETFFRAHHSHIININRIKHYHRGDGGYVTMTDGSVIDISKRRKKSFLGLFQL
ncbi:MAG: response regulator transcription factor [Sphingobacteriales bacterium]|nr:MAG: response regulator transcription factor [Sphingobacteriales bacterium]